MDTQQSWSARCYVAIDVQTYSNPMVEWLVDQITRVNSSGQVAALIEMALGVSRNVLYEVQVPEIGDSVRPFLLFCFFVSRVETTEQVQAIRMLFSRIVSEYENLYRPAEYESIEISLWWSLRGNTWIWLLKKVWFILDVLTQKCSIHIKRHVVKTTKRVETFAYK